MPLRSEGFINLHDEPITERLKEKAFQYQKHWYLELAKQVKNKSVLDVGAGTGYGLEILEQAGGIVTAIDLQPLHTKITNTPVEAFTTSSFDIVCAIDVIEHVESDIAFLETLVRISRGIVFFATPNYDICKAKNKFHIREYTLPELQVLLGELNYTLMSSDNTPKVVPFDVKHPNFGVLIKVC